MSPDLSLDPQNKEIIVIKLKTVFILFIVLICMPFLLPVLKSEAGVESVIAKEAMGKMAGALLGPSGEVLSGELLEILGIRKQKSQDEYFSEVKGQIENLRAEMGGKLDSLQKTIERELWKIDTKLDNLKVEIIDAKLQNILLAYNHNITTIDYSYDALISYIKNLDLENPDISESIITDVYGALKSEPSNVSKAMTEIQVDFCGSLQLTGLVKYQLQKYEIDLKSWIEYINDIRKKARAKNPQLVNPLSIWFAYFSSSTPKLLELEVAPLFMKTVKTHTQGLLFLRMAWKYSPLQDMLEKHEKELQAIITSIQGYHSSLNEIVERVLLADLNEGRTPESGFITMDNNMFTRSLPLCKKVLPDEYLLLLKHIEPMSSPSERMYNKTLFDCSIDNKRMRDGFDLLVNGFIKLAQ